MMVLCHANAIIQYDRRRSGLPSASIDMEYDNSNIEQESTNITHIHVQVHFRE